MKQTSPASKMERSILLLLVSVLLVGLLVAIGFQVAEELRWQETSRRFPNIAIDAPRQSLAGLNLLTIPLFLAVVFARRYIVSTALTLLYLGFLAFGIYLNLDVRRYFDGEAFPNSYLDWYGVLLPVMVVAILILHIKLHLTSRVHSGNQAALP